MSEQNTEPKKTILKIYTEGDESNFVEMYIAVKNDQLHLGIDMENFKQKEERTLDPEHTSVFIMKKFQEA